ncbi:MAG TPA: hypothetical protein VNM37_13295 [Candidatus Dormibacteraeota bacterium]|nr:hypothetical protein [Candidatus Dormibacteraeota bacterium]
MDSEQKLFLPLLLVLVGCSHIPGLQKTTVASYEPSNVHREERHLPSQIKRVAVLPVTAMTDESAMEFGRDTLGPILVEELERARLFEVVVISSEELHLATGRNAWTGEERLPLDFFDALKEKLGADAVLFVRLTQYRAYEPLSIGWRLKLLETDEPRILWAVDEVFDARVPGVAAAARRFAHQHPETSGDAGDGQEVLRSPRRFGQYTVSAVVATLPSRQIQPH